MSQAELHDEIFELESDAEAVRRLQLQCASLNSMAARYAREADRWRGIAAFVSVAWVLTLLGWMWETWR